MKILIVGGTGMIGGHAALHLADRGHDVTLAARKRPLPPSPVADFPSLLGDYTAGDFRAGDLAGFEAIVFAAGNDIRHIHKDADAADFWQRVQIAGVPAFAALARSAGVRRFIQLGSYYHQVMPHLRQTNDYVAARALADERTRALTTESFAAITLNPPSIVGALPGVPAKRYETLVAWARGERPDVPDTAPPGGTNYMSVRSLCEAIEGALLRGVPGHAYLIGDENLSFRDFFQLVFDVAGAGRRIEARDAEHPFLPDAFIVPGRGVTLAYEPDAAETALLGYRRGDVRAAVAAIVGQIATPTGRV